MASMEWKLKRCRTSSRLFKRCCVDRLSSLPDDLLSQILSMIPTKDAAAMQVVSKRMGRAFTWIKEVDLDDSPVSLCIKCPQQVECFPLFESFVDNVLEKLSQPLMRFRLRFGGNKTTQLDVFHRTYHLCKQACFPDMELARLNVWISYPLAHRGLKELDLSFYVGNCDECKLPQGLFACQSLEVLRLESNLEASLELPLPGRFIYHLLRVEEGGSSDHIFSFSSKIGLKYCKRDEKKNSGLVLFDTPNLRYVYYVDNLAYRYSVTHFNALVEAHVCIVGLLPYHNSEISFRSQLSLVGALSDVRHLSLLYHSVKIVHFVGELKNRLPVFGNVRTLELGDFMIGRWDTLLLSILHCTPLLETLIFPEGIFSHIYDIYVHPNTKERRTATLEAEGWKTTQTVPSCCTNHLQRIVFARCFGTDRELNMIKFLLCKSLVLKELVLNLSHKFKWPQGEQIETPNLDQFESTLEKLLRGSNSCSISVQR